MRSTRIPPCGSQWFCAVEIGFGASAIVTGASTDQPQA
jgi:hypothetical protein